MSKITEINHAPEAEGRIETDAAAAEKIAEVAKAEPDIGTYTHTIKAPFDYQGTVIEQLTFEWSKLTGADHLKIENELLMRGKTLLSL